MAQIGTDLNYAKQLLENDQLVAIPTETVYGLAGKGYSPDALLKIFQTKDRPAFDPLIAHTNNLEKIKDFVSEIPSQARDLSDNFWPGALTLLLPKSEKIPDIMTSGLPNVAVRIPNHQLTLNLLALLDYPLAAPSANPFGYVSPTTAKHVNDNLGDRIKYILDGGNCAIGVESTIVGFEGKDTVVYRLGGLKIEAIEAIVGRVLIKNNQSSNPKAPGMVKSHYAPGKPVEIVNLKDKLAETSTLLDDAGIISFQEKYDVPFTFTLSASGSLEEAAHNLFSALRHFDNLPVKKIYTENVPDIGIGKAINDRLARAAAKENYHFDNNGNSNHHPT